MPQEIDYNAVVRMAAGVGLRLGNHEGRPVFVYGKPGGFGMEFACQWLTEDGKYDPQQVRTQLQAMLGSAKLDEKVYDFLHVQSNVDRITKACKDFGMVYDSSTGSFYYVKKGKAVFGVDHDYIASLVCTGKASMDKLKELLETFLETAEFEAECSRVASGEGLLEVRTKPKGKSNGKKK